MEENNQSIDDEKTIGDNVGYVARRTGAGIVSGIGGVGQAVMTEAANNMNESEEKSGVDIVTDGFQAASSTGALTIDFDDILEYEKKVSEIVTDKDKSIPEKMAGIFVEASSVAINSLSAKKLFDTTCQLYGKLMPNLDEKTMEAETVMSDAIGNMNQELSEEGEEYGAVAQTAGNVGQTIGNMAPSLLVSYLTQNPELALSIMGISAKGQATQEAINQGAELDDAVKVGNAKGMVEVGTEKLTGGLKIFGGGTLDDVTNSLTQSIKNEVVQKIADEGIGIGGEVLEETISDIAGTYIDRATVNPDASYSFDDWTNTAVTTTLSTVVLNMITRGLVGPVNNPQIDYESSNRANNTTEQQTEYELDENEKILDVYTPSQLLEKAQNQLIKTLNSKISIEDAVELLKFQEIFKDNESVVNGINKKLSEYTLSDFAQQIFNYDKIASEYAQINMTNQDLKQKKTEISDNVELQDELSQKRLQHNEDINPYIAAFADMIDEITLKKYLNTNEKVNIALIDENSNVTQDLETQKTETTEIKKDRITQVTAATNKLYIESDGLLADFDKVVNNYKAKSYVKEDMDVILNEYGGIIIPLTTVERMNGKINNFTADITDKDTELEKFTKLAMSIRKNTQNTYNNEMTYAESFSNGVIDGKTNSNGLAYITKAVFEAQGIETRIVQSDTNMWNEVKIDGQWYNFDMSAYKSDLSMTNIGKYLKSDEQMQKSEKYADKRSISSDNQDIQCNTEISEEMKKEIKNLAKENQAYIPKANKVKNSMLDSIKGFFTKQQNNEILPEPTVKENTNLEITDYSPIGMIKNQILWEIQSWDKSDVDNKINTKYVLLPTIGNPIDILNENPEVFSDLYKKLQEATAGHDEIQFLGSIDFDVENKGWSASLTGSKEIESVRNQAEKLIETTNKVRQEVEEIQKQFKQAEQDYQKRQQEPEEQADKPSSQVNKENASINQQPQTIVVSDLHGRKDSWETIKNKLAQNPNLNFIILGDAMDRGNYGMEILLQIKELSDQGRIQYLPGNHDEFAYNVMRGMLEGYTNDSQYLNNKKNLEHNKGGVTLQKIENFGQTVQEALRDGIISKKISLKELSDWLGNQPLQMTTEQKGIKYALAHAVFDTDLYLYDKNFNLKKAVDMQLQRGTNKYNDIISRFKNVLWYRQETANTHYAPISWPKDYAMVVGHTPQKQGANVKFFNNDFTKPMIYIDGGFIRYLGGYNLNGKVLENIETDVNQQTTSKQDIKEER